MVGMDGMRGEGLCLPKVLYGNSFRRWIRCEHYNSFLSVFAVRDCQQWHSWWVQIVMAERLTLDTRNYITCRLHSMTFYHVSTYTRQSIFLSVYTSWLRYARVMQNESSGSYPSFMWWHLVKPREHHAWMLGLWLWCTSFSGFLELIRITVASRCSNILSVFTHLICAPQMRFRANINNVSEPIHNRESSPLRRLHGLTRHRV